LTEIIVEGCQKSNLNSKQQSEARCFFSSLLNDREYFCGLNSDDYKGCRKTITELITLWEANQIKNGKKICVCGWEQLGSEHKTKKPKTCPQCKGVRRIEPMLFINEKSGYGLHRTKINEGDEDYDAFGNVCLYCKSCQMIWDRRQNQSDLTSAEKDTAEYTTRKSKAVRSNLPNDMKDILAKEKHLCYEVVVNHWTTNPKYNCSQKLIQQVIKAWQGKAVGFVIVNKDVYGFECDSDICNDDHIVLKADLLNHTIVPIISDYQVMVDTERDLNKLSNMRENNGWTD